MQIPLQITFREMESSPALEAKIRENVDKLERTCDYITSCRVVVEQFGQHHRQGKMYGVRIDLTVPGTELVVSRESGLNHAHEDAYVAIRDAFKAARRKLDNYTRRQRQQVKTHEAPPHGRVSELFPDEGYGKIETPDGREIYFHENSVLNGGFAKLAAGSEVRFVEESGDMGPQASTVQLIGKHHIVE
jgi:ribosomal subunit interface protein